MWAADIGYEPTPPGLQSEPQSGKGVGTCPLWMKKCGPQELLAKAESRSMEGAAGTEQEAPTLTSLYIHTKICNDQDAPFCLCTEHTTTFPGSPGSTVTRETGLGDAGQSG